MKIKNAKFIISSPSLKLCPEFDMAEFALLGRSNVGKSTFINTITNNSKLAKTSNTPGKTKLINLFEIITDKKNFIIADLPGYGYAKISKIEQAKWRKNLEEYLLKRKNLLRTIQFIDARHEIQKNDILMHEWLEFNNIPSFNILTKCDYVSKNALNQKITALSAKFNNDAFAFSSKEKIYSQNILDYLEKIF